MSGEDDFIARHFAPFAGPGALGLRDDAALIAPPPGCDLVLTTDAIVAGVHFLNNDPPGDIARKALRVNLSDLAAKGATPLGFLLTLALPRGIADSTVGEFATGLRDDATDYACVLLGGDTVATPGPLTVSITAIGSVPCGRMVRRDGARPGDHLYVTGTIGDAALGLLVLRDDERVRSLPDGHRAYLIDRYRRPQPRSALAAALRDHASAAMDLSDGFAGDLTKLLSLAALSASIPFARVPLSAAASSTLKDEPALMETILSGGDDYEVLCAIPEQARAAFEDAAKRAGLAITCVGTAREDKTAVAVTDENGRALRLDRLSYSHF